MDGCGLRSLTVSAEPIIFTKAHVARCPTYRYATFPIDWPELDGHLLFGKGGCHNLEEDAILGRPVARRNAHLLPAQAWYMIPPFNPLGKCL
jgi:hypothetical protein